MHTGLGLPTTELTRLRRFLKKATRTQHRALLSSLGISEKDNLAMCAIGTTDNGLVACEQIASRSSVMLSMPVLGPDLAKSPPVTEQVNLAACTSSGTFTRLDRFSIQCSVKQTSPTSAAGTRRHLCNASLHFQVSAGNQTLLPNGAGTHG